jgi:YVTN family beta-propeller protein
LLSLTLTAGAASALTAAPAWAAGGYTLTATVPVGQYPIGVAVSPDGKHAYMANESVPGSVSVIDTATNHVTATIPVGADPYWVAVSPDGTRVYVTQPGDSSFPGGSVSVIDTAPAMSLPPSTAFATHGGWRSVPAAPTSTSPTPWRGAPYR